MMRRLPILLVLAAFVALAQSPRVRGKSIELGRIDAGTLPAPVQGGIIYDTVGQTLLHSDGGTWAQVSSGSTTSTSGVWTTAVDCIFQNEPSQTLATDGTYTICGKTWRKWSSAFDRTAMVIIPDAGLQINPAIGATALPTLMIQLSSIIPNFTADTKVRVSYWEKSANYTTIYEQGGGGFFFEMDGGYGTYVNNNVYVNALGVAVWSQNILIVPITATPVQGLSSGWGRINARMSYVPNGFGGSTIVALAAYYDAGVPSDIADNVWSPQFVTTNTNAQTIGSSYGLSSIYAHLSANLGGSGANLFTVTARMKVEYLP